MAQKPISRDFCVTSPQTHHSEVEWIRARLGKKDSNVFGIATFEGSQNGDNFGTELADGAYQMKYRLGYPQPLEASYGQRLDRFLLGKEELPPDYKERKAERKGITAPHSKYYDDSTIEELRKEAVKRARSKIGAKENPMGSNICFASDWYGMQGAWCAMFMCWCYDPIGCEATARGSRWAYVPYLVADARAGRYNLKVVTGDPIAGDLACFDWQDNGEHDHVGMIVENRKRGGDIPTVEGNVDNQVKALTRHVRSGEIETIVRILA